MKTLGISIFSFFLGITAVFYFRGCGKNTSDSVQIRDSIRTVMDTQYVSTTKTKYIKGKYIRIDTVIYVKVPYLDSAAIDSIEENYYAQNVYKDTLKIDDSNIFITDTISENNIKSRYYVANIKERYITNTEYITKAFKRSYFWGPSAGVGFNGKLTDVGFDFFMETPKRRIYGLGLSNNINGGVSIKGNLLIKL